MLRGAIQFCGTETSYECVFILASKKVCFLGGASFRFVTTENAENTQGKQL